MAAGDHSGKRRQIMDRERNGLDRQKRITGWITALWLGAVAALFGWQASTYRGFVEVLAEWQYAHLDHYYPGITFVLLCLFFSIPLLVVIVVLWRRWKRHEAENADPRTVVLGFSRRLQRLCAVTAILAAAIAFGSLMVALLLPGDGGPARVVDVGALRPDAVVPEGRATLRGSADLDTIVRFDEQALLMHRRLYFAPLTSRSNAGGEPAHFFVEVREMAHLKSPFVPVMSGVLARDALPGDVRNLYRGARFQLADRPWLLYRSAAQLRWRYYMIAAQLGVVAILLGLAARLEARRRRRLEKRLEAATA